MTRAAMIASESGSGGCAHIPRKTVLEITRGPESIVILVLIFILN
jgi:hypothetical protein